MNKSALIEAIAKEVGVTKVQAAKSIDTLVSSLVESVSKGEPVTLIGFGTFKSTQRAARTGKNPKTGQPLKIAAATLPKFSAGASFKAAVAKTKK